MSCATFNAQAPNPRVQRTSARGFAAALAADAQSIGRLTIIAWVAVALAVVACSSAPRKRPAALSPLQGVQVTFERRGAALSYWDQRIGEIGDPPQPPAVGDDYWFRLRNGSTEAIAFHTANMYMERQLKDWKLLPNGTRVSTLAEGRQILIMFGVANRTGEPIPWGSDMTFESTLESGRSVLFCIPMDVFKHRQQVFVEYRIVDPTSWRARTEPVFRSFVTLPETVIP
jgi:hypothetical protein